MSDQEKPAKGGAASSPEEKRHKGKKEKTDPQAGGPVDVAAQTSGAAPGAPAAEGAPKAKKKKKAEPGAESGGRKKSRGRPMRGLSKRQKNIAGKVEAKKQYPLDQAVKIIKDITKGTKFDQTINIVLHLGIDPKIAEQMIRGSVSLPRGIGKTKKVIAFCEGDLAAKALAAGAAEAGTDELVKKINDGWSDFDVAIAHPSTMGKVGKLGRVLGPLGKMPSPKNGTVTAEVETAVKEFAAGKIEFRNDAGGNVHAIVGKASFKEDDLHANIDAFIGHIRRMKPPTSKGVYLKKVCISGTMSPAVQLAVTQ